MIFSINFRCDRCLFVFWLKIVVIKLEMVNVFCLFNSLLGYFMKEVDEFFILKGSFYFI